MPSFGAHNGARAVLLLDDDEDLLAATADFLTSSCSCECVGVRSVVELHALADQALACAVAFLDVNLGPGAPSGIDAYQWLRAREFHGRIFFLTGHARSHPLVAAAHAFGDVRVLAKPIAASEMMAIVNGASP